MLIQVFVTGLLQSVDGYMNIALEQTREIVNGRVRREYGDAFIRGNNGEFLCLVCEMSRWEGREGCCLETSVTVVDVAMKEETYQRGKYYMLGV